MQLSITGRSHQPIFLAPTKSFDGLCSAEGQEGGDQGGGAGASPPPPPAAPPPAEGGEKPFYEAFSRADLKTDPTIQGFKTVEDLAFAHQSLLKRFGVDPARRVDLPADPKDVEGMRAVYAKLGMPEKADGYGFKLGDGATDADKAFLGRALEAFHKIGLPKDQAEGVFQLWMGETAAAAEAHATMAKDAMETGKVAVQKEWGAAYDQRAKEVGALLVKYGAPDLAKELDTPEKLGSHPQLAIFLGKILDATAEPGNAGGVAGDAAGPGRAMTPAQAAAAARVQEAHPAFRDNKHPQHKAVVDERNRLLAMA